MRSFASIATFATVAFAAVASALPTIHLPQGANGVTLPTREFTDTGLPATNGQNVNVAGAKQTLGGVTKSERDGATALDAALASLPIQASRRGEEQSIVKIVVDLTAKVQPLCDELTASISASVDVKVAVDISGRILGEIKGCLLDAKADIEAAIDVGVDLLVLDGKTLAVTAVAEIVASLVIVITTVLGLVVKVCASANVAVIITLVADISVALSAIIGLVISVCAGLLVELQPLVKVVFDIIVQLDLKALIQVLAVKGYY